MIESFCHNLNYNKCCRTFGCTWKVFYAKVLHTKYPFNKFSEKTLTLNLTNEMVAVIMLVRNIEQLSEVARKF